MFILPISFNIIFTHFPLHLNPVSIWMEMTNFHYDVFLSNNKEWISKVFSIIDSMRTWYDTRGESGESRLEVTVGRQRNNSESQRGIVL